MTRAELPERLETERLVLRVRTVADVEDIFDYASRPEVSYPAGFPPVKTLEDEIYYLEHILPERNQKENLPAGYGIVVKGTDKIVGSVDFNHRHEDDVLEIGYTLHPDYWGRGYVPEAARALIDLGFKELDLLKINKLEISRDSLFLTINGTEKYSATNIMLNNKNFIPAFKILYIGQAKGNDFNRFAQDRLKSHSTLQNILLQIIDSRIIYDIKVLLLSTSEVKIVTTMDSGKFATISTEEILDFPDESSHINLVEAKLINYFKPEFNEKFKNWYVPEEHHKSYDDYYKKKFNSMVITFENLFPCSFYTDHVKDFTVPFEIIDYSIIGSENFFESVIDPYINLKEKQK